MLTQFNRLMSELMKGTIQRNCFQPWEVELLLDLETCPLRAGNRREMLLRYQRAVQRSMENGAPRPMKLSEYLRSPRKHRTPEERREAIASLPPLNEAFTRMALSPAPADWYPEKVY